MNSLSKCKDFADDDTKFSLVNPVLIIIRCKSRGVNNERHIMSGQVVKVLKLTVQTMLFGITIED